MAIILIVALALVPIPYGWNGNEENYLLLAYRWWAPLTASPFDAVVDHGASGGKFLAFSLFGLAVSLLGFELGRLALTVLLIGLLACGLTRLSRAFGLSAIQALTALALFCLTRQSVMGGEWILVTAEAKSFAYAFAMLALANAVELRPVRTTVYAGVSFYLLFLIGAFWFAAALVGFVLAGGRWRVALAMVAVFMIAAAPLLLTLIDVQRQFASTPAPSGLPHADYIYAALRAPHHLAPFAAEGGWGALRIGAGVFTSVAMAAIAACAWWRARNRREQALAVLTGLLSLYPLVALAVSWLDREDLVLAKLYLFRPLSLILLLGLMLSMWLWPRLLSAWAQRWPIAGRGWVKNLPAFVAVPVFLAFALAGALTGQAPSISPATMRMIATVRQLTRPGDVIFAEPATDQTISLERRLERPTLANWQFVPTNPADLYRWWQLVEDRNRVFAGDCHAIPQRVNYLLVTAATAARVVGCGRVVWRDANYSLVEPALR
ncbi:hypothetical protein [Sphingomonas sp.]|uniref:hypothetical protein n=1 Tax=Sphingomonas sp. TaxID=28214 RepID=UPI002D7E3B30|nr:hypothetical protein [Sphingomonas sp.]HEU0043635.1 hypothetical protein [Sphingomonas sp.]